MSDKNELMTTGSGFLALADFNMNESIDVYKRQKLKFGSCAKKPPAFTGKLQITRSF